PEQPTDQPLVPEAPGDLGYTVTAPESEFSTILPGLGEFTGSAGDFNNDGTPDQVGGAPSTVYGASAGGGAGYVVFGQRPQPEGGAISLGNELTPQLGVAILGERAIDASQATGGGMAAMGDLTGDGIGDFALSTAGGPAGTA